MMFADADDERSPNCRLINDLRGYNNWHEFECEKLM